jgi:hypothetical protein
MIYLGCGFRDETIRQLHGNWRYDPWSPYCRLALLGGKYLHGATDEIKAAHLHGIDLLTFCDVGEVRQFMKEVVSARSGARERWSACPEASDLHRQLFLGSDPTQAKRNFTTEPWSCRGVALRPD